VFWSVPLENALCSFLFKPYRDDHRADQYELAEWYPRLRDKAGRDIEPAHADHYDSLDGNKKNETEKTEELTR
jgi:hypothetical protein